MSALALPAAAAASPVLEARGVRLGTPDEAADAAVDFALAPGELVVLFGASGAGKTALLRTWLGLRAPRAGSARLLGAELAGLSRRARRATLARVGVLFERDALFEDRSVQENVALGLEAAGRRSAAATRRAAAESLRLVGLKHVDHLRAGGLAPGLRRRVALARAVVHAPALLLADEPTHGLDPVSGGAVLALLAQLRDRLGAAVLLATRDPARALACADRGAFLHAGRIVACGPADALRAHPEPALRQLLAGRPHGPIGP